MFEDFDFYEAACHHLNLYKQAVWLAPYQYDTTFLMYKHSYSQILVESETLHPNRSDWRQRFDAAYDRACSEANFKRIINQNGKP